MKLNRVQESSLLLIQSDARFLYTLTEIFFKANKVRTNFITMSLPYIGIFVDGAAKWSEKIGIPGPCLTEKEKCYYTYLRNGHKISNCNFVEFQNRLKVKFEDSEIYFYSNRSLIEKIIGHFNVGTDLYNGHFCGNTILCAMYLPFPIEHFDNKGSWIRDVSIVAGELAAYFGCKDFPPYKYRKEEIAFHKDYHFFRKSPLRHSSFDHFCLFSILCSINFVTKFIEYYLVDEVMQKFKFAYLQYYYLCDLIKSIREHCNCSFEMDSSLYSRPFRNCLAHYGLGQYMLEEDIVPDDPLKGLTIKAFGTNYLSTKVFLYDCLNGFVEQIASVIF